MYLILSLIINFILIIVLVIHNTDIIIHNILKFMEYLYPCDSNIIIMHDDHGTLLKYEEKDSLGD